MEPIKEAKGTNGQLYLYEDKIRISRRGFNAFLSHGLKGDKEIFLNQISSIQLKKGGFVTSGYIQFAFLGGQEAKGGLFQGTTDENTITFTARENNDFEQIKDLIEKKILKKKDGAGGGLENLKELKKLFDEGVITAEEFSRKKEKILGI